LNEDLTEMIVKQLVKERSRNEIIRSVCEQGGMNWPQAEKLVRDVEAQQAHSIASGQSPLLILLSVGSVLIGLLLLYLAVQYVMDYFQGQALEAFLNLRTGLYRIIGGITGLGMIAGGLIGLWKTFYHLFET
jgi:hypothetical protein